MNEAEDLNGLSLLVRTNEEGPYLVGGRCGACSAVFFPRQSVCPRCTGGDIEDAALSRKGTLHTYTEVCQGPPDYEGEVPYIIGRVRLPEGVYILTQLKGEKDGLKIDMDMELVVEPIYRDGLGKDRLGYKFKPV